jgi:hypothetical protein
VVCVVDEKIKSLEEELNNANDLLEQARSNGMFKSVWLAGCALLVFSVW